MSVGVGFDSAIADLNNWLTGWAWNLNIFWVADTLTVTSSKYIGAPC
jgi:hypothetical protein